MNTPCFVRVRFLPVVLFTLMVLFAGHVAQAAPHRIALVMGVWQYDSPNLPNLPGIEDDVKRYADGLKKLGFDVEISSNPTMSEAKNVIDQFGEKLKQPDSVGLFYFSGHGSEHGGENYLIPRKANLKTAADLGEEAVAANRVIHRMEESGSGINLMFLDCCRCPIKSTAKSADGGFAQMKASGVFIGYATASEKEANASTDGSIYTNALLKFMGTPGLSINDMHTKVTGEVERETAELGVKQTPFQYSGLNNLFYMVPEGSAPVPIEPAVPVVKPQPPVVPGNPETPVQPPVVPGVRKGGWLFTDSSSRYLAPSDVAGLSADDAWRARNEIYARNGYIFATEKGRTLARLLGSEYRPVSADQDAISNAFNQYESANVDLLRKIEQRGGPASSPQPNTPAQPYNPPPPAAGIWLFADSSTRRLSRTEVSGLNAGQLWRARNEIYARHGYIFSKAEGKAFARSLGAAYTPRTASADAVEASFNKVEEANVKLIKSLE